ncbi:MAG TPA: hypothetical protein VG672_15620, partial [Bryobacteraceae bacterium]|nr:hypothetical protein [Bryobacteraceae bacterium]
PAAGATETSIDPEIVRRHDAGLERLLQLQISDPASPHRGAYPDDYGIYFPGSAAGMLEAGVAAFLYPGSRYHADRNVVERLRLAAAYLQRVQSPDGNVSLPITNFNSPPDTAFVSHGVGTAACLAQRRQSSELFSLLAPLLRSFGAALARGGVHTPNHRWVVSAALAQIHEVLPAPSYPQRIDQWLAESIDIDSDGQYTERSTGVYNHIVDRCLTVIAAKRNRPNLLEPVRRNLESMLYLVHPGDEVVTEISHRQDQFGRASMGNYWFPLLYLAHHGGDGRFAALARRFTPDWARLSVLMEYPELVAGGPASAPLPEDYEKPFPELGIVRIRRGPRSATLILNGSSRFVTYRHGAAVVNAVRFASAFFGKGQFIPEGGEKRNGRYQFHQRLSAGYYQPLDPARVVRAGEWAAVRPERRVTELCRLEQSAEVSELPNGLRIRLRAHGTDGVPLAVEISLREGGELGGVVAAPHAENAWILGEGYATFRQGGDRLRIGPGLRQHSYTQIRGAQPKLPGSSIYLCGYTPFDHTVEISVG